MCPSPSIPFTRSVSLLWLKISLRMWGLFSWTSMHLVLLSRRERLQLSKMHWHWQPFTSAKRFIGAFLYKIPVGRKTSDLGCLARREECCNPVEGHAAYTVSYTSGLRLSSYDFNMLNEAQHWQAVSQSPVCPQKPLCVALPWNFYANMSLSCKSHSWHSSKWSAKIMSFQKLIILKFYGFKYILL